MAIILIIVEGRCVSRCMVCVTVYVETFKMWNVQRLADGIWACEHNVEETSACVTEYARMVEMGNVLSGMKTEA